MSIRKLKTLPSLFPRVSTWTAMPALVSCLGLIVGIVAAQQAPFLLPDFLLYHGGKWCAILFLGIITLLLRSPRIRFGAAILVGVFLALHQRLDERQSLGAPSAVQAKPVARYQIDGRVVSEPLPHRGRHRYIVRLRKPLVGDVVSLRRGKHVLCHTQQLPSRGDRVVVEGVFMPPRTRQNPGGYDDRQYLLSQGVWGRFYGDIQGRYQQKSGLRFAFAKGREFSIGVLGAVKSDDSRAILHAAFLGEKHVLSPSLKSAYRDAGLYHILAISGLHVGILGAAVFWLLSFVPLTRPIRAPGTIVVLWLYVGFVGMIPSLFRAVVMATVVLGSLMTQRKGTALNSLGLAGIVWLYISPMSLFQPGFQLSFAATAGIIILFPRFRHAVGTSQAGDSLLKNVLRFLALVVGVTACAFVSTAPVLAYHFGTLSLFGLIGNMLVSLLMPLAMQFFFAALVASKVAPFLAPILAQAAGVAVEGISAVADLAGFVPWSVVSVPTPPLWVLACFVVFVIGVGAVRGEKMGIYIELGGAAIMLLLGIWLLIPALFPSTEIVFFFTKEGHLTGIRLPNGKVWVVVSPVAARRASTNYDVLTPWIRRYPGVVVQGIIATDLGANPVHTLEQFTGHCPRYVVLPRLPDDLLAREDLVEYVNQQHAQLVVSNNAVTFSPCDAVLFECFKGPGTGTAVTEVSVHGLRVCFGVCPESSSKDTIPRIFADTKGNVLFFNDKNERIEINTRDRGAVQVVVASDGWVRSNYRKVN